MKNIKYCLLTGLLLLMSVSVFAGYPPTEILAVFKNMYPKVANAEWVQKGNYHIAGFMMDGNDINVWFNAKPEWIMTETEVEGHESIPASVATAFMKSPMSSMKLEDISIITFPKHPTVIVIEVEGYDFNQAFQLFYALNGTLLQNLNVSDTGGEIYPGLFE